MSLAQRLALTLAGALCGLALIALGWQTGERYLYRKLDQVIAHYTKRLGTPIEIGPIQLGWGTVRIDEVRIGAEAQVLISVLDIDINLNPFTGDFGEPSVVSISDVRIKSSESMLRSSLAPFGGGGDKPGNAPGSGGFELHGPQIASALDKVFAMLPSRHLVIGSGYLTVVGADGQPTLTLNGLKLAADKAASRVIFRLGEIKARGGLAEKSLQGRFELRPHASDYRFFVRRKLGGAQPRLAWAVAGTLQKDLSAAQLNTELHEIPAPVLPYLQGLPFTLQALRGHATVELTKAGDLWQFVAQIQSQGSRVLVPLVSGEPIGPVYFDLKANGSWQSAGRLLAVDAATLTLPKRETREYGADAVPFLASGTLRLAPKDEPADYTVSAHLNLPSANCQAVLDAAPAGLLPALTDFKLDGRVAAVVDLDLQTRALEDAHIALSGSSFSCRVTQSPPAYTAARLNGPFSIERQLSPDDKPFAIAVGSAQADGNLSPNVATTFVASEDAGFYGHNGVDAAALETALHRDLAEHRIHLGGSTITMQTAKNLFLSPERTFGRKLQEIFLAWHLEQTLTKDRILAIYMSVAELGPGIYGVPAAAEHFFGKDPRDLNLHEAAYLATLLPSPRSRYRYFCRGELTANFAEMVNGLLRRMVHLGRINPERSGHAIATPLRFNEQARLAATACEKNTTATGPAKSLLKSEEDL